ncbi:caspase family protein [Nostoc linckia FACHB-104]|nr:caspase family protein [Nostoc linckia FACHB-104]
MAKIALLIGVSEYEPGLTSLPAATKDVEAMRQVLDNSAIGAFDEIEVMINPQRERMAQAIEALFAERQKDDLLLLFFSGHGIKDESGKLYFATRNTSKTNKGALIKATTVPASFVHEVMNTSRSRREVVILDCCFSGAFAEGMAAKDDGFVDVKNQLGGEGRAILTSSTSTQYSFEQQGSDTSTYTHYIVEGLETGAADKDEDGWISADELHEYATKKVQGATPAMKPEIYAIKEGYKIQIAQASRQDPKLKYRREFEYWLRDGEISYIGRTVLNKLAEKLKITPEDIATIEAEVLKPYQDYQSHLEEYKKALIKAIGSEFSIISESTRADLKRLQQFLGLRDEDIALIETSLKDEKKPTSTKKYIDPQLIGYLFIGIVVGVFGVFSTLFIKSYFENRNKVANLENNISLGEEILIKQDSNSEKQAGVEAFAKGNFGAAIEKFKISLSNHLDDPETLIYLNNSQAAKQGNTLKIAVAIPIGINLQVAKEILRGVAQAQNEFNQQNGAHGRLLQVVIANDNNEKEDAKKIADNFVNNPLYSSVLAVVGHNSSEASIAAHTAYDIGRLVMISPTSDAHQLPNDPPIFHTMPAIDGVVQELYEYAKSKNVNNIIICWDDDASASRVFREKFQDKFQDNSRKIINVDCNLANSKLNINNIVFRARVQQASMLLLPGVKNTIDKAIEILKLANQQQVKLVLASSTMNTAKTIEIGSDLKNLVLAVPWNPVAGRGKAFADKATQLWGKNVNWHNATVTWRTAMAYDATKAIITAIEVPSVQKSTNPREELKNKLGDKDFFVNGVTGKVHFQGDRKDQDTEVQLLQLGTLNLTTTGYEIVQPQISN